ncbi:MAG TPA: alpha/beta fold hydrolase [Anaeromyxobacteraceae bacterium]|nr:alpha/beta fold hydrolase [Anaeromyxobacteraceae bacterium]
MSAFAPARWLPGRHLGTVFASVARPLPRPRYRRERFDLDDGDFLDLDRIDGPGPDAPLLVISHGLEGSSRAPYVRGLAACAARRGLAVAAWNFRGCSGEPNRLIRQYHSGDTEDLDAVVRRLATEAPGRPLLLCGFSLGANQIVKWLAERGPAVPSEVRAAAAVSTPFDLAACARALDGSGFWPWVYRERFLRRLRRKALAKATEHPGRLDARSVRAARTFAAYDEIVTAPLHGFAGAEDYWTRSSSGPLVRAVRHPLLLLSAADDPLVPAPSIPLDAAAANPAVTLEVTPGGGHVAFVAGWPWRPRYWAEGRVLDFLARFI